MSANSPVLPPFDAQGNLPPGMYRANWDEITRRFGRSAPRRRVLAARLRDIADLAKATGFLTRVFVWGSFVTGKRFPRDVDLFLSMRSGFDPMLPQLRGPVRELFNHEAARLRYEADIFWATEAVGEAALGELLSVYQMTGDFTPQGIVEVILDDPESPAV
jgi:hypothetical protein